MDTITLNKNTKPISKQSILENTCLRDLAVTFKNIFTTQFQKMSLKISVHKVFFPTNYVITFFFIWNRLKQALLTADLVTTTVNVHAKNITYTQH